MTERDPTDEERAEVFSRKLHVEEFENYYIEEIKVSPKVVELIVAINAELELGVSDGMIDFDAFSIMYMLLEHKFKDEKESNAVK